MKLEKKELNGTYVIVIPVTLDDISGSALYKKIYLCLIKGLAGSESVSTRVAGITMTPTVKRPPSIQANNIVKRNETGSKQ